MRLVFVMEAVLDGGVAALEVGHALLLVSCLLKNPISKGLILKVMFVVANSDGVKAAEVLQRLVGEVRGLILLVDCPVYVLFESSVG